EIYAWGEGQVIKLFLEGWPEEAIRHEEEMARLVMALGLAAPRFYGRAAIGHRTGLIYERIEGPSMLQALLKAPWRLVRYAERFAALHAAMHREKQPGLPSYREGLAQRIRKAPLLTEAEKAHLLAYLEALPAGEAICHGDFHPDNILISPHGPVIIDWNDAKRGAPAADVARTVLLFRMPISLPGLSIPKRWLIRWAKGAFLRAYLRAYCRLYPLSLEDVKAWLLPVAAGRLAERIPGEARFLLEMIRARLSVCDLPGRA
ncbi:MAG: phosphotransferase, partial [Chloroflexi bacterium]|nr:phosphotransferase [Chloroflexota bacterium]